MTTACHLPPAPADLEGARPGGAPEAEEVLRVQSAAWNRGEIETFVELGYWNSPELTFFSGGSVTRGLEPLIARYKKRYLEGGAEMGELSFSELESLRLGPVSALVRGRWRLFFGHDDAPPEIGGLFSLILCETSEGWRIVHDHTSQAD